MELELGLKELAYLSLVVFMLVFGYFVVIVGSEEDPKNGNPDEDPKGSDEQWPSEKPPGA